MRDPGVFKIFRPNLFFLLSSEKDDEVVSDARRLSERNETERQLARCFLPHFTPAQEIIGKHTEREKSVKCFLAWKLKILPSFIMTKTIRLYFGSDRASNTSQNQCRTLKTGPLDIFQRWIYCCLLWSIFFYSLTLVAYQHISVVQTWTW